MNKEQGNIIMRRLFILLLLSIAPFSSSAEFDKPSTSLSNKKGCLDSGCSANSVGPNLRDQVALESFVDGIILSQLSIRDVPGITVSIVNDGEMIFSKGYGFVDVERMKFVDPATSIFRAASISKLFTIVAVMQLVEQGRIDLNADISTYSDNIVIKRNFDKPIRVIDLLSHTAGFENVSHEYKVKDGSGRSLSLRESLARSVPEQVRVPGTTAAYGDWGTSLAGLIVSNVSGQLFEDYIQEHIFAPLGMTASTFKEPLPNNLKGHVSSGFVRSKGYLQEQSFEILGNYRPAASLSTTAVDISHFMIALLQSGEYKGSRILKAQSVSRMLSVSYEPVPGMAGIAHGFWEAILNGHRAIGHMGSTNYFRSELIILPKDKTGFFISTNSAAGSHVRAAFRKAFMDKYFPGPALQKLPHGGFDESRFTGVYRSQLSNYSTSEKSQQFLQDLYVSSTPKGDLYYSGRDAEGGRQFSQVGPSIFRDRESEFLIGFDVEKGGVSTHFYLQNRPYRTWERLQWWEESKFHALLINLVCFIMVVVVFSLIFIWRSFLSLNIRERVGRTLLFFVAIFGLMSVKSFLAPTIANAEEIFLLFVTIEFNSLKLLLIATVIVTFAAFGYSVLMWVNSWGEVLSRIFYMVITLSSALLLIILSYWNAFIF
jgi:CubicO group peptidase (beta-lactamase class C family)